jgi:hypothetical protein
MKSITPLILLLLLFASPAISQSAVSANQILMDLDANYYYPQQKGLKKIQALISWDRRDFVSGDSQAIPGPPAILRWEAGSKGGISRFSFPEQSRSGDSSSKDELERFFKNYSEMILPTTLKNKFSMYTGKIAAKRGDMVHLSLEPKSNIGAILKYEIIADVKKRRIKKVRVFQNQAPTQVTSVLSYTQNEGLWRVAESRSKFTVSAKEYSEVIEFFYKKIKGTWLVNKLRQSFLQDGQKLHVNIFRFEYK